MWNPDGESWAHDDQEQLRRAKKTLARQETVTAEYALKKGEWFRALCSAENALSLDSTAHRASSIAEKAKEETAKEKQIFSLLHEANNALQAGYPDKAIKILQTFEDHRLVSAFKRISEGHQTDMPTWASNGGIDVYGQWATLSLNDTVDIRLRWVEPGIWHLPEHLYFRNKQTAPFTKNLTITNGFWLAETETTIEQWLAIEQNPNFDFSNSEKEHPVSMVNYLQIIDWLEQLEQKHPGLIARLPFEEEWLFAAAVSGQQHAQPPIETESVHALSISPKNPGPLPVKTLIPNLGGYYGMGGSVMEWTASAGE
jgi:formylglycine-generating enzyme required for sulfatase activity